MIHGAAEMYKLMVNIGFDEDKDVMLVLRKDG